MRDAGFGESFLNSFSIYTLVILDAPNSQAQLEPGLALHWRVGALRATRNVKSAFYFEVELVAGRTAAVFRSSSSSFSSNACYGLVIIVPSAGHSLRVWLMMVSSVARALICGSPKRCSLDWFMLMCCLLLRCLDNVSPPA